MPFDWATFGVDLHLELDRAAGRRGSLERALRDAIRSGRLAEGTRLPSTRALAAEAGVSRGTATAAYDQLVAEGFLTARTGSGTVVAPLSTAAAMPARSTRPPEAFRYDFKPGSPDVATFPTAEWLRCARRALARAPQAAFDYGDPQGRLELRVALTEYLGRARGVLATPDQIVVTNGYIQALALLTRIVDGSIATEDPGLAFHREVLAHHGKQVLGVPVDGLGAKAEALPEAVRGVVLTPAHQYPTGVTLHPSRRHAFVRWARATGGIVIEDDYDGEFRYDRQPVGALQGMAPDHVIYIGTASKTLGPALRLGWVVLPPRLVAAFTRAKHLSDYHTETIGQLTLAEMITSHAYDRHVRACRLRYRHRRDLLVEALAGHSIRGISAGLHALIDLETPERDFLDRALRQGIRLGGLEGHWHRPGGHPPGVIVGYGTPHERVYPAALEALRKIFDGL